MMLNWAKMPKFYKEPARVSAKAVSGHQRMVGRDGYLCDFTPDEMAEEGRQDVSEMDEEAELPF